MTIKNKFIKQVEVNMEKKQCLEELAPGLFEDGTLRKELLITPELLQTHLDVFNALPRNVKSLSAATHDGYVTITAEVSRRLTLFLNVPKQLVFTVSIEEFYLTSEKRKCVITLDGPVAERGHNFVVQLAVTLVEDLLIFLLMGKRVRFASRYTTSVLEWPRVEVDLDSIEEICEITDSLDNGELWDLVHINSAIVDVDGVRIPISEEI